MGADGLAPGGTPRRAPLHAGDVPAQSAPRSLLLVRRPTARAASNGTAAWLRSVMTMGCWVAVRTAASLRAARLGCATGAAAGRRRAIRLRSRGAVGGAVHPIRSLISPHTPPRSSRRRRGAGDLHVEVRPDGDPAGDGAGLRVEQLREAELSRSRITVSPLMSLSVNGRPTSIVTNLKIYPRRGRP